MGGESVEMRVSRKTWFFRRAKILKVGNTEERALCVRHAESNVGARTRNAFLQLSPSHAKKVLRFLMSSRFFSDYMYNLMSVDRKHLQQLVYAANSKLSEIEVRTFAVSPSIFALILLYASIFYLFFFFARQEYFGRFLSTDKRIKTLNSKHWHSYLGYLMYEKENRSHKQLHKRV